MNPRPSTALRGLFPADVVAFESEVVNGTYALHPAEAAYVSHAAPGRVAEYAAGRACARAALAQLEVPDFPVHVGPQREPIWPPGFTGSITHTGSYCGVVVAKTTAFKAVGIDAEARGALDPDLWSQVITPKERCWLLSLPRSRGLEMSTVIFSAKEAFFKCQYQLTRRYAGFLDVDVTCESGAFQVSPREDAWLSSVSQLSVRLWVGRFAMVGSLVVSGIGLTAIPEGQKR
jgi:4'-phosphopantetheinyl transferase EntD